MSKYNYVVPNELKDLRIDKAMSNLCTNFSRSLIQKAIKNNKLLLNNKIISNLSTLVKENDKIEMILQQEQEQRLIPSNTELDIIYEDQDLIVLNKSSNMTVHPGAGNYNDTLVNALLFHTNNLSDIGGSVRPGIVHRLDKNTSGLIVVAKNNKVHHHLAAQIESRTLIRKYKALIWGRINQSCGIIDISIGRSRLDRKKMTTLKHGGKRSVTHYKTLEIFAKGLFSLVECRLETGRTHQIRVHLSHIGHSIVGDQVYGNNKRKINSCTETLKQELRKLYHQALHSFYISFSHPINNKLMEFKKDIPIDYNNLVEFIRKLN